jgi:hypothetical protein
VNISKAKNGKGENQMANLETSFADAVRAVMTAMLRYVSAEKMQEAADSGLDAIQSIVDGTRTPIDDALVEPIMAKLRETFDVPDGND